MEILRLILTPQTEQEFDVYAVNFGKTESNLPFFDHNQDFRSTLISILEITASPKNVYNPQLFSEEEKQWLVEVGIVDEQRQQFLDYSALLANLGYQLYQALFPPGEKTEAALKALWQKANQQGDELHIQLQFEADSVGKNRAADYPWELIHDGQKFLAWHKVSFSRYIAYGDLPPNLPPVEKVNVLLVSSEAFDNSQGLNKFSRSERKAIADGLELACEAGHINLIDLAEEVNDSPTFKALQKYLSEHRGEEQPHILHFDGHGIYGKKCPKCEQIYAGIKPQICQKPACNQEPLLDAQGYLVFEDEKGNPDYISAETLGATLKNLTSEGKIDSRGRLSVVVLSACQSGMSAEGESVFNGIAQKLIAYSLPAVVAMQYSVTVEGATKFAEQFYTAIGQKDSLAFAVLQSRIAMGVEGNQWYRPVLYLRWDDNDGGQLFALEKQNKTVEVIPSNLPLSGASEFIGREEELEKVADYLDSNQQVAIAAIAGMGGVGKTELALQYAHYHYQEKTYPGGVC